MAASEYLAAVEFLPAAVAHVWGDPMSWIRPHSESG